MATRKAGEVPVKAWAGTLPSVASVPVGSVRTQVTPSRAAPRTCQLAGVEFEAEGAAEFVEGEVDGAGVIAGGGGQLGHVAPAGGAGGALEVLFARGGCGRADRGANTGRGAWGSWGVTGWPGRRGGPVRVA